MNKILCYTMLFLLLVSSTSAAVVVQLSNDNITFFPIEGLGGSSVDLNSSFAFVEGLQPSTTYFFRARNGTANFTYGQFTTKSDREILPTIVGLGVIAAFFIWLGILSGAWGLKVLFYGLGLVEILTIALAIYFRESGQIISDMLFTNFNIIMYISFAIAFIVLVIFAIKLMMPNEEQDGLENETDWMEGKW